MNVFIGIDLFILNFFQPFIRFISKGEMTGIKNPEDV